MSSNKPVKYRGNGPNSHKVLLWDASGWRPSGTSKFLQNFLTAAWGIGTRLFSGKSIGADSWRHAYGELDRYQNDTGEPIRILHVWGHGSSGNPRVGNVDKVDLELLAETCPELEAIWWRSCDVHAFKKGKHFARRVTDICRAASIGHCEVITWPNPLQQRAICGLRPGEEPHWFRYDVRGKPTWCSVAHGETPIPLPDISTFRSKIPWAKEIAWWPDATPAADSD